MDEGKGLQDIAHAIKQLAGAVTPLGAAPCQDAQGGHVGSLTEAVLGMTAALTAIASAIQDVADKLDDRE